MTAPRDSSAGRRSTLLVLLVEDDEDNRAMYRLYLEWEGFDILEATDGLQALRKATTPALAAIVMDLALPRLDGLEAVRRLKADPRTKHIPVLALTAHAFVEDARRAKAAGCDAYLAKPCLPDKLARTIRSLVEGHRRARRGRLALVAGGRSRPGQGAGAPPSTSGPRRQTRSTSMGAPERIRPERAAGS
jgi:two-component system, cell cycle response regulator DivK